MGKSYIENSLKRFLKRKVKITLGLVVTFMITGTLGFAANLPFTKEQLKEQEIISEKSDVEKAEYFLNGYNKNENIDNFKTEGDIFTSDTGKINIKKENGKIKIIISEFQANDFNKEITLGKDDLSEKTTKNIEKSLNLIKENGLTEKIQNGVNNGVYTKSQLGSGINNGILIHGTSSGEYGGQEANATSGNRIYNYGIILDTLVKTGIDIGSNGGQVIYHKSNAEAHNFGLIYSTAGSGQWARGVFNKSSFYNYGTIIAEKYSGQYMKANGGTINSGNLLNYGIINAKSNGQYFIGYSSGNQHVKNGEMINYGIIKAENGQVFSEYGAKEAKMINYGLIEANKFAQSVTGATNTAYNYGIIKGENSSLIEVKAGAKAYNEGIIFNTNGTGIFSNDVNNKANVINNGMLVINGDSNTDNFTNNGVVLNSSFDVINKQGINKDVIEFADGQTITNSTVGNTATGKESGYIKNGSVTIAESLENKNLNTVITKDSGFTKDKAVFTYENKDNQDFSLINTTVTGYFQSAGTLLDVKAGEIFTIAGDTKITAIKDSGLTGKDVTAVKLSNGAILNTVGKAEVIGKIEGAEAGIGITASNGGKNDSGDRITKTEDNRDVKTIIISNANQNLIDNKIIAKEDNYTDVKFTNTNADDFIINFGMTAENEINKIVLGENVTIKNGIDGSKTTEKNDLQLEISNINNIGGDIKLGASDDSIIINKYEKYDKVIDMGEGTDSFTVNGFAQSTTKADEDKELGTFNYKLIGTEKLTLKGNGVNGNGWYIGENASLSDVDSDAQLSIENTRLYIELNNDFGKGNITTSLDKLAGENGANKLTISTSKDDKTGKDTGLVKFIVGDKFNVSQKQFNVAENYSFKDDANITAAVIFKGTGENGAVEEKDGKVTLTVKDASDYNGKLDRYNALYDAMLAGLSGNEELKNAVNYSDEKTFVGMIEKTNNTAEAFYTTGYAVTKDVTDTYMSVVDDFGRKAGKGEWIAYGKYVNSDTEFDGGKASKGYDGDITGTVGMLEYGVNDTTSYGVVYGQGDTEVDIQGGGKLDGDNTYFGGYVKHRTQGGFDLTGNVGYTKSELDLNLATSAGVYNMITSGKSDADALTFALKGKKDYLVTDTVKLQPVFGARYTLINQDAVESSDANYRMDEQDVTIFEGMFGGNAVKEFDLYNGKLSLSVGAEYVLADVSKSDDARYTLYGKEIALTGEEDIADNRIEGHIGIDYEHESGVGVDTKYEMIWTDKGDNSRVTAGISYRF